MSERQASVQIVVCDTGIGITADEQDQPFTRFCRPCTAGPAGDPANRGVGTTVSVSLPEEMATTPVADA